MYYRPVLHQRLAGFRSFVESRDPRRLTIFLAVFLTVALTLIISSSYLPSRYDFQVGEVATETLIAPRTLTFQDDVATEELRREAAERVEPVYRSNPGVLVEVTGEVRALFARARSLRAQSNVGTSMEDKIAGLRELAATGVSDETLLYLLQIDASTLDQVEQETTGALRLVLGQTVTEESLESQRQVVRAIAASLSLPAGAQGTVAEIASSYLRANTVLDIDATEKRREEAAASVAPVVVSVAKGETVVTAGQVLSRQQILKLQKLGLVGTRANWKVWTGVLLTVLLEIAALWLYLRRFGKAIKEDNNLLLAGATLLVLFALLSRLLSIPPLSPYLVPMVSLGIVGSIVLGSRAASLLVVLDAVNLGLITGLRLEYALVALISGLCAAYLVSHLIERSELLSAGAVASGFCLVAVFAAEMVREAPIVEALEFTLWGAGAGLLGLILSITLLEVFEVIFNLTTPLRLLELGNPAQPLLRRLMQEAPGTYNHSIMVGNLAEAAAEAVGADPLLTRVGAYYHDIGKVNRPEYFIENQLHMHNPHDRLNPNLSKLAITAHVGDGVELARRYGLPRPVVDIIKQHHGTSVLSYFYYKAKQNSAGDVTEETYRYDEDKPTSREAAIIMLADSVEAAVKAMQHPTMKKIQMLIRDVIRQKMEDGQLDRSQLTFGDLGKIADAFLVVLRGVVGHRIEYPSESKAAEAVLSKGTVTA